MEGEMKREMKRIANGVKALGDFSGSLLVIGTLVAVILHLLHGIWAPIPDVLPFVSLPT